MPAVTLTSDDLVPFADVAKAKADAMITDVVASAARVAPCIRDDKLDADLAAAAKAILRGAVLRWHEAGTGTMTTVTTGSMSATMQPQQRRGLLWPSEVTDLEAICTQHKGGDSGARAFSADTAPAAGLSAHLPWCDLFFGGRACSCGVDIAGVPIFEGGVDS